MIRILIADDHQMFREGLMALLNSDDNINVIGEASNGKEALLLLEKQVPDVLLLDLEMPEIDGFDVLKALKKLNLETKVLVLTMHKSPEFIKNIIKAKIVLKKPILKPDCRAADVKVKKPILTTSPIAPDVIDKFNQGVFPYSFIKAATSPMEINGKRTINILPKSK